jgi:MFS family permease
MNKAGNAFGWSYALMQLPIGAIVDRVGPRITLGIGLTFWSLAQGIGGLCTNFTQFIWARIFLGVGEAPHYPTLARVVSNWFPPRDRGVPVGLFNAASPLGTALAPILTGLLA